MAVQPGSLLVFGDEAYTSSLHGIMEVGRAGACKAASCRGGGGGGGGCSAVLSEGLVPARLPVAGGAAQLCCLLA